MNEIYWITRFNAICITAEVIMIVGIILSVIVGLVYYINNGQAIYDKSRGYDSRAEEYIGYTKTCIGILKWSIPTTIIACLFYIFTPTTKQALLIYGVGGTVDYIKSNPTAKQIPDKCINALDKWVDSWSTEQTDSVKKKE